MTKPTLTLTPLKTALPRGQQTSLDILVKLTAPAAPETTEERTALNLAIVLDRSGSMSGRPLHEAKRCAAFLIDRLTPRDRASVVVYDNDVDVVVPALRVSDKEKFLCAISRIETGGMTALHDGWLKGAEVLSPHASRDTVSRVILLSDGCANEGETDERIIANQCAQLADAGITTSTYGLGESFNEDLMISMANGGRGNAYYGERAEDLMDPFMEEFELLSSLMAKQVELSVQTSNMAPYEILNSSARERRAAYRLPDLAYDGEAWAVVRVNFEGSDEGAKGEFVKIKIAYKDLQGAAHMLTETLELPYVPYDQWVALEEIQEVIERANELEVAALQEQAQRAARREDWDDVERYLSEIDGLAEGDEWIQASTKGLRDLAKKRERMMFAKESGYMSRKIRTRLALSSDASPAAENVRAYLRKKPMQGRADQRRGRLN